MTRIARTFLRISLFSVVAILSWGSGKTEGAASPGSNVDYHGVTQGTVQLWTYWGSGSEAAGLNAVVQAFNKQYPGISIVHTVIPGGPEMRQKLGQAFLGGGVPDMFALTPGYNFKSFVDIDRLAPITDVWNDVSGDKVFPKGIRSLVYFNNVAYGIPLDLHTISGIWYNVTIFKQYDLKVPTSWAEFDSLCAKLKQNGVAPIIIGGGSIRDWPPYVTYPFLVDALGVNGYIDLGRGKISFTSPEVRQAFANFKQYAVDNLMPSWSAYGFIEAAKPFMDGKVAMYMCMGDWMSSILKGAGMKQIDEFDVFPAPTHQGISIGQIDAFAIPKGATNIGPAKQFLKFVASPEAQKIFNSFKGAVAPNLNTPADFYDPIISKMNTRLHDPAVTFLPNMLFMFPPELWVAFADGATQYALTPTQETLDKVLQNLENMRLELSLDKKWVNWEW